MLVNMTLFAMGNWPVQCKTLHTCQWEKWLGPQPKCVFKKSLDLTRRQGLNILQYAGLMRAGEGTVFIVIPLCNVQCS